MFCETSIRCSYQRFSPDSVNGSDSTAGLKRNLDKDDNKIIVTDAIRDEKVLKFKVDYNDVRPQFKAIETEQDEKKLSAAENKQALLHPDRIREILLYILNNFRQKNHRLQAVAKGFNARRYIATSLKREFASDNGTELNAVLPKLSPLNPQYLTKKQSVFQQIATFVEKLKGVGGQV